MMLEKGREYEQGIGKTNEKSSLSEQTQNLHVRQAAVPLHPWHPSM